MYILSLFNLLAWTSAGNSGYHNEIWTVLAPSDIFIYSGWYIVFETYKLFIRFTNDLFYLSVTLQFPFEF